MGKIYNNEAYEELIKIIISDTFYCDNVSYDVRISQIRRFTEVILRRLLHCSKNKQLTVGDKNTKKLLEENGFVEDLFWDALKVIKKSGNVRTHTEKIKIATREDFDKVVLRLFDLYGYMFYKYFEKYEFGSNPSIVTAFSILPPIIRHITLRLLYDKQSNRLIEEKLLLATVKAYDFEYAKDWLESQRDKLEKINNKVSLDQQKKLIDTLGIEYANMIIMDIENKTVYDELSKKLSSFTAYKPLYKTFEEAVVYYKKNGIVEGETMDVVEFNDLMEFVYIGRKEKESELEENQLENDVLEKLVCESNISE